MAAVTEGKAAAPPPNAPGHEGAAETVPFTEKRKEMIDRIYNKSMVTGFAVVVFSICTFGLSAACVAKLPHWPIRSAIIFNLVVALMNCILGCLPWVRVRPRSADNTSTALSGKCFLIGFTFLWLAVGVAVAVTYSKSPPQGWQAWHDGQHLTKRRGGHGGGHGGGFKVSGSGGDDDDDEDFFNGVGGELIAIMVFDFVNVISFLYRCLWLSQLTTDLKKGSSEEKLYAFKWHSMLSTPDKDQAKNRDSSGV